MVDLELVIHLILSALVVGSLGIWIYLFLILKKSFHFSPQILKPDKTDLKNNFVSIIIPARNEEKFIKKCILSLLNQQYTKDK